VPSPQTTLAERYIEEGLRMDEHPLVYFREGASGRRPALLGTRLDGDEIDEWIDRARAIAEREEARWDRRGEALDALLQRHQGQDSFRNRVQWLSAP
jgi:hypothetical protein